jgi:hypothetical protein
MSPPSPAESPSTGPTKPRRRPHRRSGFYALKATIKTLGPRVLDRRTALGKELARWRDAIIADLGGSDALSTQQRALVDVLVRDKLLLDSIDAALLAERSLVNGRKRAVYPVVLDRLKLADGFARRLATLGLDRKAAPVEDLRSYIARRTADTGHGNGSPTHAGDSGRA